MQNLLIYYGDHIAETVGARLGIEKQTDREIEDSVNQVAICAQGLGLDPDMVIEHLENLDELITRYIDQAFFGG